MYSDLDLFGNERSHVTSDAPAVTLDLFTQAAERAALASGRPLSQERIIITHPETED